jgi:site-specific DNA recombinase
MSKRAAVYVRISKDDEKKGLGVQRQEKDMRAIAKERGAQVTMVLRDNDLSASGKVLRPAYEQLIDAINGGQIDVVLAYDLDRLNRGLFDFFRLYQACEKARIVVGWRGGEADFASGTGLFEMELRASFAREELRKIRSRTQRKHQELAENGKDAGGGRPFGYEEDRLTLRPAEAELIREAARRALSGEPLRNICRDWQRRGIVSPWAGRRFKVNGDIRVNAGRWSSQVLRRILMSARISGRRELKTVDGKRGATGAITSEHAEWPAIVSVADSDRLRAIMTAPERTHEAHPRKYLLTGGLLRCARCGKPMHTMTPREKRDADPTKGTKARQRQLRGYACIKGPGFSDGCGRMRINAEPLEKEIIARIFAAVDHGALRRALKASRKGNDSSRELDADVAQMKELAEDWSDKRITRSEWQAARAPLAARLEVLQRRVESERRGLSLDGIEDAPLRSRWPELAQHQQRAVLQVLVQHIEVHPAKGRGPVFDPSRVKVTWKV